jgi:DNA-binding ferritin-like protein
MNSLIELNAMLRVYNANFLNIHWNAATENFDDIHKGITTDYYELCDKYIDITAEMIARFGVNAPNYIEVAKIADEKQFLVVDSGVLYDRATTINLSDKMLGDICKHIVVCLDEIKETYNSGIKSDLEAMLSEFDLQYRYINKRRMATE